MARQKRHPPPQIIRNSNRGNSARRDAKAGSKPKKERRGVQISTAIAPFLARTTHGHHRAVAKQIVLIAGSVNAHDISVAHVGLINLFLQSRRNAFTRHQQTWAARVQLRYLTEHFGAPKLAQLIKRCATPKPRNVTATDEERARILRAASPQLRCWLLLCSDAAIRSGTAALLGPEHYDAQRRVLTFRTKYANAQTVPVTAELGAVLDTCRDTRLPFVAQLPRQAHYRSKTGEPLPALGRQRPQTLQSGFRRLKKKLGITRKLTPHDLRRTTVRKVYDATHDLRVAQALLGHSELRSTLWYLQGQEAHVELSTLEHAKLNPATEAIQ